MSSSNLRQRKPGKQLDASNNTDEDSEEEKEESKPSKDTAPVDPSEKYKKFVTRSFWGTIMIVVFAFILYMGHAAVSLFVILIQCMMFRELLGVRYKEAKERKLYWFRTLHWYFLFGTLFYVYGPPLLDISTNIIKQHAELDLAFLHKSHLLISFMLYVVGFVGFISTLKKGSLKYQFGQLTWTLMTLLIVVGQSNFIIHNIFEGLFWFLFPCSLIICNDIMAYMCGFVAGRKFIARPLTKLSPNKTWEGFIGALFCTLVWAFVFSKVLAQYTWFTCPKELSNNNIFMQEMTGCTIPQVFVPKEYQVPALAAGLLEQVLHVQMKTVTLLPIQIHAFAFALFASLIAPFGGFFASGIKRAYQKKDFDSLFPGHGGVTDRMDCELIMGLFTYVYHTAVISTTTMDATAIILAISQLPASEQSKIFSHFGIINV